MSALEEAEVTGPGWTVEWIMSGLVPLALGSYIPSLVGKRFKSDHCYIKPFGFLFYVCMCVSDLHVGEDFGLYLSLCVPGGGLCVF